MVGEKLFLTKVSVTRDASISGPATWASHSLLLDKTGLAKFYVQGRPIATDYCSALQKSPIHPSKVTFLNFPAFLQFLDKSATCPGNPDDKFVCMARRWKNSYFQSKLDASIPVIYKNCFYLATLRSSHCHLITSAENMRCSECVKFRKSLGIYHSRWIRRSSGMSHKFTKNKVLSTPQRSLKFSLLARKQKMQLQTIRRLKAKIENWVNTTSVEIHDDLAEDVAETLEKHADAVKETFPEGSFQRLFWDQ